MEQTAHRPGLWMFVLLGAVVGLIGGCGYVAPQRFTDMSFGRDLDQIAVDVENFRGHVEIRGDDASTGIEVDGYVWLSWDVHPEQRDAAYAAVSIDVEMEEPEPGLGVLRVRTASTREEFQDHHAKIVIRVPRLDGVRVVNMGGVVEVVDHRGEIFVENQGPIDVRTSRGLLERTTLLTSHGTVWLQAPEGSSGSLDLETLHGQLKVTDPYGLTDRVRSDGTAMTSELNGGGNMVVIRTGDGDILVRLMDDPLALNREYHGTAPDFSEYLMLKGSGRHNRNLPDDSYLRDNDDTYD